MAKVEQTTTICKREREREKCRQADRQMWHSVHVFVAMYQPG